MDNNFIELSDVLASLDPDYLAHHGIKGQKWGVEHGPPYPLKSGVSARIKKAAKTVTDRVESNRQQKAAKKEAKAVAKAKKKETLQDKLKAMSDQELDARAARLRKENAYLDEVAKMQARKGESFLTKSAATLNNLKTAGDALSGLIQTGKKLSKAFGLTDDSGGVDTYDWHNWRTRKKGETEKQYAERLNSLSNIKKRAAEFTKAEEEEKKKKGA